MWRVPEEAEAIDAATRLDKAAAVRRSTIRREATVRPQRGSRSPALENSARNEDQHYLDLRRLQMELQRGDRRIEHLEFELQRLRRNSLRTRARMALDDENEDDEHTAFRDNVTESHLRETLLPEPVEPELSRMSQDLREVSRMIHSGRAALRQYGSTSPRRYRSSHRRIPSPPISRERERAVDGPLIVPEGSAALTPGFAPARGPYQPPLMAIDRLSGFSARGEMQHLETPPPEEYEGLYPPLRRVSRASPRVENMSSRRFQNFEDRLRSLSPRSSSSSEDMWETLLTTMDSSDSASTTQTSFASNRSESATRSNGSSQTTTTSFGEIGQVDEACELDLPRGITAEDVRHLRAQHHHAAHVGNSTDRMRHLLYDREDRSRRDLGRRDPTLGPLHTIHNRLQRRQEVPDELWVAAGVTPVLRDQLRNSEIEVDEQANA